MHESRQFFVVPYNEPDGRVTFAVQEKVERSDYYLRHLVSFHPTLADAIAARDLAQQNEVPKSRERESLERLERYRDWWFERAVAIERENAELRGALAAYRSALRSGEPETEQLRALGDAALADQNGDKRL